MIKYFQAEDITSRINSIVERLALRHIKKGQVVCIRSKGSQSRRTLARCHALPRIMQIALEKEPHYVIEVISEQFDKLSEEDQTKTLIHELMHIPHSFGGGFRHHHPYVNRQTVEGMYKKFLTSNEKA